MGPEQVRDGCSDQQHDDVRDGARLQRDDERLARNLACELVEQDARRNAREERDEREREEGSAERGRAGKE